MKKLLTVALMLGMGTMAFANGLSLNSIGPRAAGMGGAYVGYANDASALYWNPAGLATQQSSVYFFIDDIIPMGTYKYDPAMVDATMKQNHNIAPNLIGNYRMDKWAFSFGIYVPSGLAAEWDGAELQNLTGGQAFDWMSKVAAINFSPAVAYQVSDQFSVGLAVNIYYAMFEFKRPADMGPLGTQQYSEESTGLGYSATLGLKYDINEQFSVGLTARMNTKVSMEGTAKNPGMELAGQAAEDDFDREVDFPLWAGIGFAYKPNKQLTLTFDAQYSQWSTLDILTAKYKNWTVPLSTTPLEQEFILKWEDATQFRLGAEYCVSEGLPIRLGYYYDPAPAPDETLNILIPSSTNHVITGGLTYYTNNWGIDFFAEYQMGAERDVEPTVDNMPGIHQLDIIAFGLGFSYAF